LAGRVETKHEEYHEVINATRRAVGLASTGGVSVGQVAPSKTTTSSLNAAIVVSLDKHEYAKFIGRNLDYISIPRAGKYVLQNVRWTILDIIADSFDRKASPAGQPWPALEESTKTWRRRYHPGSDENSPLIASGELKNSVDRWARGRGDTTVVGKNTRMVIGLDELPEDQQMKAFVHNIGGNWGWRDASGSKTFIPPRPFLAGGVENFSTQDQSRIQKAASDGFNSYLDTVLDKGKSKAALGRVW
jgi:phage gpG-like protein